MTGIQASQAIEAYTLRFTIDPESATSVLRLGSTLTLPSGMKLHLGKGTVLVVRSAEVVAGGWVEVAVISQEHLMGIARDLLAD